MYATNAKKLIKITIRAGQRQSIKRDAAPTRRDIARQKVFVEGVHGAIEWGGISSEYNSILSGILLLFNGQSE